MILRRNKATKVSIPRTLNQRTAKALLEAHGWTAAHGSKHLKMVKQGHRPVTLPMNKGRDYPPGMRKAILKEAGLEP